MTDADGAVFLGHLSHWGYDVGEREEECKYAPTETIFIEK